MIDPEIWVRKGWFFWQATTSDPFDHFDSLPVWRACSQEAVIWKAHRKMIGKPKRNPEKEWERVKLHQQGWSA